MTANNGSLGSKDMTRLISSHVEASKIGRQIAEEVMDLQRKSGDSSSPQSVPSPSCKDNSTADVSMKFSFFVLF